MTTGVILTPPVAQFFDNAGNPAVNGTILTTVGGINTATYSDVNLTTPLPNPIPLNSRGEISSASGASSQCFLTPNTVYTFTLYDSNGTQLWQATYVDGVQTSAAVIRAAIYPQSTAEIAAGVTPTDTSIPWGWITRYGAVGDDSTDNTTAIQSAVNQCAQSGDPVFVPHGIFQSDQISLANGVTIYGAGYFSCIKLKNSGNDYVIANTNGSVYVDDVLVYGLQLNGNKTNNTSGGGFYGNGRRNTIRGCYVYDFVNAGIQFGVSANGATNTPLSGGFICSGNIVKNCGKSNSWGQIAITHGTGILIENNYIICDDVQTDYGVDIEPNPGNIAKSITINGNVVIGGNIQVDGAPLAGTNTVEGLTVVGNYVDARGRYNPTDKTAMAPLWFRQIKDFNISGNVTHGHDTRTFGGIVMEGSGITTTYSADTGCISNNVFRTDVAAARSGYMQAVSNVTITGNNWQVNTSGNAVEFGNAVTTNVRGASNIINNAGAGYAIRFSTGTNIVFDASNSLTGLVDVAGSTSSRVSQSDIYGTAVWDIGNTANLGMVTTTVPVTGATRTKGMGIKSCLLTTLPTGWALQAAITASDTVSVIATNLTGGNSDPASGTLSVTVSRDTLS